MENGIRKRAYAVSAALAGIDFQFSDLMELGCLFAFGAGFKVGVKITKYLIKILVF